MTTTSVLSWNLWWRFGPWEERLPAIIETIRRLDPDIACLQEVWFDGRRSSADRIADALGYAVVADHLLEHDGYGFGNAILSRWPIAASEMHPLPADDGRSEGRAVLYAAIDSPIGPLQAYCTHLNWRYDDSAVRQAQVRSLSEFVATKRPRSHPPIVAGDFNAVPGSEEIRMMTGETAVPVPGQVFVDSHTVGGGGPGITWSNDNPFAAAEFESERRIDYVFVGWRRPDGTGAVVSSRVVGNEPIDGVWPSDHYGVLAELRQPPSGTKPNPA